MYLVFTGFLLALPISVVEQTFNQIDHILSMSMLFLWLKKSCVVILSLGLGQIYLNYEISIWTVSP